MQKWLTAAMAVTTMVGGCATPAEPGSHYRVSRPDRTNTVAEADDDAATPPAAAHHDAPHDAPHVDDAVPSGQSTGDVRDLPRLPRGHEPLRPKQFKDDTTMSVHLLDVGQGAATLLEFPCGAVLVDTGGELNESFDGAAALMTQLEAFFARRTDLNRTIDLLVITHPHIDHVRGLPLLLDSYTVRNVVDNGRDGDDLVSAQIRALRSSIERNKTGYRGVNSDEIVNKGGMIDAVIDPIACTAVDPKIRVLSGGVRSDPGWGTSKYGSRHYANENNHSVVLRVDFGNASILITGDLEENAIHSLVERYEGTRWLDVDVYQAGHHGSANGTTRELLRATTPLLALIAMGDERRHHSWTAWAYGHPRAVVVDLLDEAVAFKRPTVEVPVGTGVKRFNQRRLDGAIYGTGWDGAVVVDMDVAGEVAVRRVPR